MNWSTLTIPLRIHSTLAPCCPVSACSLSDQSYALLKGNMRHTQKTFEVVADVLASAYNHNRQTEGTVTYREISLFRDIVTHFKGQFSQENDKFDPIKFEKAIFSKIFPELVPEKWGQI